MVNSISPNHLDTDYPPEKTLEQKIEIFTDRVNGWQLYIAQQCADKILHSGFAVLHIVSSYFEMIAKFKIGFQGKKSSGYYFKKGFEDFLSQFPYLSAISRDELKKRMWEGVRCGLYHSGITRDALLLGDFPYSIEFNESTRKLHINPHRLVPDIQVHFQSYLRDLNNLENNELRRNFEVTFEYLDGSR
jgi:hypothetical protein